MTLEMKIEIAPQTGMRQMLEPIGKVYEIMDYWQSQPKLEATLRIGEREHKIRYVFAPQSWLDYLVRGERYGAYLGDMIFINSRLQEQNQDYLPFVLLKLYGEKFVDPGMDKTGRVQHWQSLWATIRVAGQLMDSNRLYSFLSDLQQHESSRFFELDGQVKRFMEEHRGDLTDAKRRYLDAHHNNLWVARGRNEELFANLGMDSGFRNHAEAILSSIKDLDTRELYLATGFVRAMSSIEPDMPVQVGRPFNSYAYALTKKGNGITDLVKFIEEQGTHENDVISKLPGKMATWSALSKRLSYNIHTAEKRAKELAEKERYRLNDIVIQAGKRTSVFEKELGLIKQMVDLGAEGAFSEAKKKLQGITMYGQEITKLEELSASIAERMRQLEELSGILSRQI